MHFESPFGPAVGPSGFAPLFAVDGPGAEVEAQVHLPCMRFVLRSSRHFSH